VAIGPAAVMEPTPAVMEMLLGSITQVVEGASKWATSHSTSIGVSSLVNAVADLIRLTMLL